MKDKINKGHFNYTYKLTDEAKAAKKLDENYEIKDEEVIKGWWVETSDEQSDEFTKMQLVIGDSSDGIKGIEGKGIKYWENLKAQHKTFYSDILDEYIIKYGTSVGIFEFQKNYRLLHMLENDEDFMREVGKLPEFPIITEVKKESNNIEF